MMGTRIGSIRFFVVALAVMLVSLALGFDPVDYSDPARWMHAPRDGEHPVDVFYLYPTAREATEKDDIVCAIDNPSMLDGARQAYGTSAAVFEPLANVYAPYYRQADAVRVLGMEPKERETILRNVPAADAIAAFEYYLANFNNGKPFILAGHSQGSNVLLYVMDTYLKQYPDVMKRMIAAYVPGYSVTDEYLSANPHLSFGRGPDEVGVILSWNTESGTVLGPNPVVEPGAQVINPLTWTTGTERVGAELNRGARMIKANGDAVIVNGYASARIDPERGTLICDNVDVEEHSLEGFPKGVFHASDYPLYFINIRENAKLRSDVFLKDITP